MLRIQVYPVMDGVEVWLAWNCGQREESHANHVSGSVHRYVPAEDVDKRGVEGAVALEVTVALAEWPDAAARARC